MRGGQLVCLSWKAMFLFEGRGTLYSPILKEFIDMLPETVDVPKCRYNATHVAMCVEYGGHSNQRGCWAVLRKDWKKVASMRAR